jgi:hypothetical protein
MPPPTPQRNASSDQPARTARPAVAEHASEDAPLLVLSFPRSGTTLLRAMIHGHPEMAVLPEPWWMVRLLRTLEGERRPLTRGLATSHLASGIANAWYAAAGLSLEDVVTRLSPGPMRPADVISAVGRTYAERFGKARWGAKYPGSEFRRALPLLHGTFPRATFLFLARDVRDVYLSQVGAGLRRGTADLELYCLLWSLQTRKILQDLDGMGERGLLMRYEDLLADPEESLERICTAAGLATTPEALEGMLDYQDQVQGKVRRNPIHRNLQGPVLAGNRRKFSAELSAAQIRRTEILGRAMLERLGYADPGQRLSLADRAAAAARIPPRLALNLWRNYRGRSTVTGMDLRRRG